MKSPDLIEKIKGARQTVKLFPTNPHLLQAAEEELLKGYEVRSRDRNHADAMSWMCNVLGRSQQLQYRDTLEIVYKTASNRKIRKYARKNYNLLR